MNTPHNIVVLGAGVVGLSTAVCIQDKVPSAAVTIIADKFGSDTLSDGAAGLFRPTFSIDSQEKQVRKWCKSSLDYFNGIISTSNSKEHGVRHVTGFQYSSVSDSTCYNPLLKELLPVYKLLSKDDILTAPPPYKYGVYYETVVADCRYYLPWLLQKFHKRGGKSETLRISKLSEVSDGFDVVVNCTGLGAKELLHDNQLVSIRGQTIKVKAPWIKNFYYGDEVYVVPGLDYVTLGGVKEFDSWNMNVNPYHKKLIWEKCLQVVPSLKDSEFLWDWVGLRPYRPSVCLDSNIVECDGKFIKVVNNYGHGGHGITLSWGTAIDATECVQKLLDEKFLISKL